MVRIVFVRACSCEGVNISVETGAQRINRSSNGGCGDIHRFARLYPFFQSIVFSSGQMLFARVDQTPLAPLIFVFTQQGIPMDECQEIILDFLLPWSADLYFFIENELNHPPFDIATWFQPDITQEQRQARVQSWIAKPPCCDDAGISCKVSPLRVCSALLPALFTVGRSGICCKSNQAVCRFCL